MMNFTYARASDVNDAVRQLAQNPSVAAELVPRIPELIPKLLRSLQHVVHYQDDVKVIGSE